MNSLLATVLLEPQAGLGLNGTEYGCLIAQGRVCNLLGTLALRMEQENVLPEVPSPVRRHLTSAAIVARKQTRDLAYEVKWLKQALDAADEKLVLLKGAAYLQAELPAAGGRLLSDVDILVPAHRVADVENSLMTFGWTGGKQDPYNERYYLKSMH